ncbi:Rho GTPase activating protein [Coemansia interrupta]|uniref:Rho GTPase activating protein n=1 Tax=Coemansia interrupta TaxID=1126814 RepID=A0A9W8HTR7_9FUNG|nr:Rho GTPase activating protein [Coemansia interrupta]
MSYTEAKAATAAAPGAGMGSAIGDENDYSGDEEMDVIHIIQERDAYKRETERLRKIIENQRFIIKSLQDQMARKQSFSSINTPSVRNSGISTDAGEQAAGGTPRMAPVAEAGSGASNALGLSSLSVKTPTKGLGLGVGASSVRKGSQGSSLGSPLAAAAATTAALDTRESLDMASGGANMRPWAKSTRLSEIYADYSARHNSVSPMFKPANGAWAGPNGAEATQDHARIRSTSGSSFTESLKASIRRTEWPTEWGAQGEAGYASDRTSGVAEDASRRPSLTPEAARQQGGAYVDAQPKHDSAFGNVVSAARTAGPPGASERRIGTPVPDLASESVDINGGGTHGSAPPVARSASGGSSIAPSTPLPAAPTNRVNSPAVQSPSEVMVLRPVSMAEQRPTVPGGKHMATPIQEVVEEDADAWQSGALQGYEYEIPVGAAGDRDSRFSIDAFSSEQGQQHGQPPSQNQPMARSQPASQNQHRHHPQGHSHNQNHPYGQRQQHQQHQQHPSAPHAPKMQAPSPSRGPGPAVEKTVTWNLGDDGGSAMSVPQAAAGGGGQMPGADRRPSNHQIPALLAQQSTRSLGETAGGQGGSKAASQSTAEAFLNQPALTSLDNIDIQIKDSRIKIDERGKEVNVYMIDVVFRRETSGLSLHEMIVDAQQPAIVVWTVEKRYSDFVSLHSSLRQAISRERVGDRLERLPEKELFRANAPTKSDRRKQWFERYLKRALTLGLRDQGAMLQFLSTNRTMEPEKSMPILLGHKEGFLVKKGKNFGGWKRRYYVCKSTPPVLEYSDSPGGSTTGQINLSGAVVKTGKARAKTGGSGGGGGGKESDMFRHAFMIEERPRREGKEPVSHPLWAESDRERDEWVMALRYVIVRESDGPERAMKEVERYASYTRRKDADVLMIQQIQTSITHEQGARRSIEHSRWREEQREGAAKMASPLSNQLRPQSYPAESPESDSDLEPPRAQRYADAADAMRSPVLAATLSTSFSGGGAAGESLAAQGERLSVHYVPSEISTIESSIYSSYNGGSGGGPDAAADRGDAGGRSSYASVVDDSEGSPAGELATPGVSAIATAATSAADSPLTGTYHADASPARPQQQQQQPQRLPFTKNAVGRIVHEEEAAPELPENTPLVTTDILGIGRQDAGGGTGGGAGGTGGRSREEKKRGRITFMWGKRRAAETSDHPVPDSLSPGTNPYGAPADAPPVPAPSTPRRLRRGSTSNDVRSVLTRAAPFKGPVFGMPLELAVDQTRVKEHYHLPAVVYRCLEYLDAKKAWLEEGIYRLSGAALTLASLRKEFNSSRDYNLLKLSKPPDVHAVANLLKAYLRELPEKVLTTRLYLDFVRVADLAERSDRVHELGCLVSDMPLANYTLLRALTAHLIRIVQKADVNRMTLRNIGIVFSPSLGIPVHLFNLLMVEFEYIFWVNDSGVPEPRSLAADAAALSASVPTALNRLVDTRDAVRDDSARPAPSRHAPPSGLRHVASRPELGTGAASDATGASTWAPTPTEPMFSSAADLTRGYSRYPPVGPQTPTIGAASSSQGQGAPLQPGRSNRNSIQYNVGAPRELIFQETAITVPARILESEGEDDDFLGDDHESSQHSAPIDGPQPSRPWS